MHFDLHLRRTVRDQIENLAGRMAAWDLEARIPDESWTRMVEAITPFEHQSRSEGLVVGGVDGSGDYPGLAYGDCFVHLTVAAGTIYAAHPLSGLREAHSPSGPLVEFTWVSTRATQCRDALLESFGRLAGIPVEQVIRESDYRLLKVGRQGPADLQAGLIIPPAHDGANLGIQLRTTGELGAALRLIESVEPGSLVLFDGTLSLPFVQREPQSLFFEHLRRLCCVRARDRGVIFAALSKSHGLPNHLRLEEAAHRRMGVRDPEHWFLRFPDPARDGWTFLPADGPQIPPVGAVSYLVRLHRSTPIMRLDLDAAHWQAHLRGETPEETRSREAEFFGRLDYASHDQRSFGYPYPLKAAHDRASLTGPERSILRKQIIEAAMAAGMKRSTFKDPSQLTGHRK